MFKSKITFPGIVVLVLLIAACTLDDGTANSPVDQGNAEQELAVTRGVCTGQPTYKSVTYTDPNTFTVTVQLSQINQYLSNIANGGRSYYYQDTCHRGYIKSTAVSMVNAPTINQAAGLITCTLRVTYSGTVALYVFDDPCADYPGSKTVTVTPSTLVTITAPTDSFSQQLSAIYNGSRSYYYTDSCYKGSIPSVSFTMPSAPTYIAPNYLTCQVRITYSGTVYKK